MSTPLHPDIQLIIRSTSSVANAGLESTYLVVREETGLLGVFAGFPAAVGRGVYAEVRRIRKGEGPAVRGHAYNELFFRRAELDPHRGRVVDAQLFLPLRVQ